MNLRRAILVAGAALAAGCGSTGEGRADAGPDALGCQVEQATAEELAGCGPTAPPGMWYTQPCLGGAAWCTCEYGHICGSGARWTECRCEGNPPRWSCQSLHCDPVWPQDAGPDGADAGGDAGGDAG